MANCWKNEEKKRGRFLIAAEKWKVDRRQLINPSNLMRCGVSEWQGGNALSLVVASCVSYCKVHVQHEPFFLFLLLFCCINCVFVASLPTSHDERYSRWREDWLNEWNDCLVRLWMIFFHDSRWSINTDLIPRRPWSFIKRIPSPNWER